MGRIWIIGGTSESAKIARLLVEQNLPCTVTVTTRSAIALYPQAKNLRVKVGCLDDREINKFLVSEQISVIVDASHPYAVEVSRSAIASSGHRQIPYLRYERPQLSSPKATVREIDSFGTLLAGDDLLGHRVLLTVGYKALPLFQSWQDRCTLFARILPAVPSLEAAIAAGFSSERIIALRPPVNEALEKALWQQWQISLVVTKASGKAGGEGIKRTVAEELGIPLIVISRPKVDYPQKTNDLAEVLSFCLRVYA